MQKKFEKFGRQQPFTEKRQVVLGAATLVNTLRVAKIRSNLHTVPCKRRSFVAEV